MEEARPPFLAGISFYKHLIKFHFIPARSPLAASGLLSLFFGQILRKKVVYFSHSLCYNSSNCVPLMYMHLSFLRILRI